MVPSTNNTNTLLNFLFNKRPFVSFVAHWVAWQALHFVAFSPTFANADQHSAAQFFFNHFILSTLSFLLFYLVAFFIMPGLGMKYKQWGWMVVVSLLAAIVFTYFRYLLERSWMEYLLRNNLPLHQTAISTAPQLPGNYQFLTYFQSHILINVSIVILAFAYRLTINWYRQESARKELETKKLQAELSYLKMQVNPHFLFNALNNIYSLSVIENSQKTGDSIMKLSELMRYVLYEKEDEGNKVLLDNEISHINNYMDLERLRYGGEMYVNFSIEGDTHDRRIAPLLLFPLIENAFKHGVLNVAEKPVIIELKLTKETLDFSIRNYKKSSPADKVGGIGIQNVRKRLELIYGDQYNLDVRETGEQFFVNLHLPI